MATISRTRFVIAVPNLQESDNFYRDVLGFSVLTIPDPGWRFYTLGVCTIMAGGCRDAIAAHELGDHSYFAYLEVDDIDEYYASILASAGVILKTIRNEPWGMREFGVATPHGHRIMFGAPVSATG